MIVGGLVAAVVYVLLLAWGLMLLIGGAHHEISADIPPIGYAGSVIAVVLLSFIAGFFRRS